jgi:MFS family permease
MPTKVQFHFVPWLMWAVSTLFFAYQFIMRLAPGLVMPELMQKFSVDASEYGLFAAIYYFAYSGMQIPVALLLDRYGPRVVITLAAAACSLGTLLLVYAESWTLALLGRFLIGAGSAAGFLGASKVISLWFKEENYSKMVGLTFTFGLIGAVYGGRPVGTLIALYGFEHVLALVGYLGLLLSAAIFILIRSPRKSPHLSSHHLSEVPLATYEVTEEITLEADDVTQPISLARSEASRDLTQFKKETKQDKLDKIAKSTSYKEKNVDSVASQLKLILTNRKVLMLALANFLMVGSLEGFADVWGVPYLMTSRGMLKTEAAQLVSTIFVGMLFGGPLLAYFANKLRSNYWVTALSGILMGVVFIVLLSWNQHLPIALCYGLFFIIGILCCYQVLIFSIGVSLVPKNFSSLTVAFLNCINMLGGSFFHSIIGQGMDFFWNGALENGIRVYNTYAFTWALSSIAVTAILGGLLVLKVKN